jgi:hypothetical protein
MAFSNIAGAEPSTVTFRVGTVVIDRGSTTEHQEILVLGDPNTSNAQAAVLNTAPASTAWGVIARIAGDVRAVPPSTAADNPVVASQTGTWTVNLGAQVLSSATPAGNSSAVVVRVAGGPSSAVDLVMRPVFSSTGTDNPVSAAQASTVWAVQAAPINIATPVSSAAPASGSSAVVVRQVGMTFDSSNALQVNVVDGTITASTTAGVHSSLVSIAGAYLSSAAVAANSSALNVRVVGGASSGADFPVSGTVIARPGDTNWASSAGFHFDSSGALQITGASNSTMVTVRQSTAADLQATVTPASTTWAVQAAITQPISTATPAHGSSAVLVRQVISSLQSATVEVTSSNSTALYTVLSSAAVAQRVFAFSITSTAAVPSTLLFMTASTTHLWGVGFGSGSSGVTGANLAVAPPGFLFAAAAGEALQCVIQAASTGQSARISVSWLT